MFKKICKALIKLSTPKEAVTITLDEGESISINNQDSVIGFNTTTNNVDGQAKIKFQNNKIVIGNGITRVAISGNFGGYLATTATRIYSYQCFQK